MTLCDQCNKNSRRGPKRKRGESETSVKSVFSGVSAETQLSYIEDEGDLECDGADTENNVEDDQRPSFVLASSNSLNNFEQKSLTHQNLRRQRHGGLCPSTGSLAQRREQRQFREYLHQHNAQRKPSRLRNNYSESDTSNFGVRRFSAGEINVTENARRDSMVILNEADYNGVKVCVARNRPEMPLPVKSAPNLNRLYDSLCDDDSGYIQNNFTGPNKRRLVGRDDKEIEDNLSQYEELVKDHKDHRKYINRLIVAMMLVGLLVVILVILMALLLSSTIQPGELKPSRLPERRFDPSDYDEIIKVIKGNQKDVIKAPLRLEGVGLREYIDGNNRNYYRLNWKIPERDVQNPITLTPGGDFVRVNRTGYYFVFCRIHYIGNRQSEDKLSRVEHSLYKVKEYHSPGLNDHKIDSVSQNYMMNNPGVEHTSTLQTIIHLTAGSRIYIRLGNNYFIDRKDFSNHVMGIFML